jgi:hypothetical protein
MRLLLSLAVVAAFALPATAGEKPTVSATCLAGFDCQNHCPLAKQANQRRALGAEALTASKVMRAERAKTVAAQLAKI